MPDNYSINGIATQMDVLLAEMRAALRRTGDETFRPTTGRGMAAHGRVRATVGERGHLTELVIDRHWLATADHPALVRAVKEAVCGAVDDVHAQIESLPPITDQLEDMVAALDQTLDGISNDLARAIGRSAPL